MRMARIGSFLFLLSSVALAADPAPTMTVVVTPNPVVESQSVQLRIEVETAQSPVVYQPTFTAPDFVLVGSTPQYGGGPSKRFVGGQAVPLKKTFFEYVLSPKNAGAFYIRNIKTKVGNAEISSPDVMVKVLPDTSAPPVSSLPGAPANEEESSNPASPAYSGIPGALTLPPDDLPASFNSDFTVHASINKKRAYVGEPIVIEYWLYDFGALRQMEVQKWPTFNGFWKDDLEIASRFQIGRAHV